MKEFDDYIAASRRRQLGAAGALLALASVAVAAISMIRWVFA